MRPREASPAVRVDSRCPRTTQPPGRWRHGRHAPATRESGEPPRAADLPGAAELTGHRRGADPGASRPCCCGPAHPHPDSAESADSRLMLPFEGLVFRALACRIGGSVSGKGVFQAPRSWAEKVYPPRDLLPRGRQGRPLRRLGRAAALRRRASRGIPITVLTQANKAARDLRRRALRRLMSSEVGLRWLLEWLFRAECWQLTTSLV